MVLSITINGDPNIVSYSVQEDATPLSALGSNGGIGQLTYVRTEQDDDERTINTSVSLHDDMWGDFDGLIRNLNSNDGLLSVTADSILSSFDRWYTIPPFAGTLQSYLTMVGEIVGEDIYADATRNDLVVPGFMGNVWDGFRQFLVANKLEVSQVGTNIIVRDLRTFNSVYNYNTTEAWTINSQDSTEKLKVYWYDVNHTGANIEVFAPESPFSVEAGETMVQEITIEGSLSSVNQPNCLDYVPANTDYTGTVGAYCVAGNDGRPIMASQWIAQGGSVSVRLTDDPSIIEVTVVGCSSKDYAPYRIAATAGTSNNYNSLHVTGDGMAWEKNEVEVHSGAPRATDAKETSQDIDNRNVTSLAQAYNVALSSIKDCAGGIKSLNGTSVSLSRPIDRPSSVNPLIQDFNLTHPGMTFSEFNTYYAGYTIKMFNDEWLATVEGLLANQAFGQVIGARALRGEANYRVQSLTTTPNNVQYILEMDTLISDFDSAYGTMSISQFNDTFDGYRFVDFTNRSLAFGDS